MSEKERETALQLLKEKFPERYKELVEQYYKSLSKGPEKSSDTPKNDAPKKDDK